MVSKQHQKAAMGASSASSIPTPKTRRKDGLILLRDASPEDAKADDAKAWAESMAAALRAAGLDRPAARVRDCAEALFFDLLADRATGEIRHRLRSAPYCRYRHCPVCQGRRSLRNKAKLMTALPRILDEYPTARFAVLMLSVRNCDLPDLRATATDMAKGWQRLIKRKDWPALGWVRALEVTRADDGRAHPHYHALLMVPASYFTGRGYVPTREWVQRWREAMRLDYDPVCYAQTVKASPKRLAALHEAAKAAGTEVTPQAIRRAALVSAVAEVAKYSTKAADLLAGGPEWLAVYVEQVHALKIITTGGVLKGIMRDLREVEDENLVDVGDGHIEGEKIADVAYHWNRPRKGYARKRNT